MVLMTVICVSNTLPIVTIDNLTSRHNLRVAQKKAEALARLKASTTREESAIAIY